MADFDQSFINTMLALWGATMGWVLKVIWDAVKDLQEADEEVIKKVNDLQVVMAGDYVKRDELRSEFKALFAKLDRIENKLDQKADK